jgi:uncharacterized RDD family membrane protein YckC
MTELPPPPGFPPPAAGYPPPPGYGPPLANFGERLLAKLLDGLILSAVPFIISILGIVAIATGPSHSSTCTRSHYYGDRYYEYQTTCRVPDGGTIAIGVALFLVAGAVYVGVSIYYYRREGRTGLTWGRKAMGIRLLKADTMQPIGSWQSFGRGLFAAYISSSVCYLGYLWMLWDPRRQCWHDKVAESLVVKDGPWQS